MGFLFDRNEFLIFFDTEEFLGPIDSKYTVRTKNNMIFSLSTDNHERDVEIRLEQDNGEKHVFSIGLTGIYRITCDKQNLYFYKSEQGQCVSGEQHDPNSLKPFLVVTVKPTVSLNIESIRDYI